MNAGILGRKKEYKWKHGLNIIGFPSLEFSKLCLTVETKVVTLLHVFLNVYRILKKPWLIISEKE
jgi:hypothetical protein